MQRGCPDENVTIFIACDIILAISIHYDYIIATWFISRVVQCVVKIQLFTKITHYTSVSDSRIVVTTGDVGCGRDVSLLDQPFWQVEQIKFNTKRTCIE